MPKNSGFRAWFYFRNGWSLYFAFIFAAINTLTVTFYLAIEKYPTLNWIFPTFFHYILVVVSIGVPLLVLVGYIHYKRSSARKAEVDISYETDAYKARTLVNTEITIALNMKLLDIITKISKKEEIPNQEYQELEQLREKLVKNLRDRPSLNDRTFKNKMDLNL
jgi:hypothetical protein|tara:strand:+ start:294 stop:785 length:492 start_codon:yes stop_codon:yes gene_type:complete